VINLNAQNLSFLKFERKNYEKTFRHDELGEVYYEESIWTGKKELAINGRALTKLSKKYFPSRRW
jgi:hypothetical protein